MPPSPIITPSLTDSRGFHRDLRKDSTLRGLEGKTVNVLDGDQSGLVTYRINSLGFRGEEYNPNAARHIHVFGCSYTFGLGLDERDLWSTRLRNLYAHGHHLSTDDVNLLNFGLNGASNAEIARQCVLQCSAAPPDLVFVMFTHQERIERVIGSEIVEIGPWTPGTPKTNPAIRELAEDYYLHYTDEQGAMDLVRQMLFVQSFLIANNINYLLVSSWAPRGITAPAKELLRLVDRKRVVWLSSLIGKLVRWGGVSHEICHEYAADKKHPGRTMHEVASSLIWRQYIKALVAAQRA